MHVRVIFGVMLATGCNAYITIISNDNSLTIDACTVLVKAFSGLYSFYYVQQSLIKNQHKPGINKSKIDWNYVTECTWTRDWFFKVWNTKETYVIIKIILKQFYKLNKMQK